MADAANLAATSGSVTAQIKDPTWLRRHDARVRAEALRDAAEHSIVVVDAENGYRYDAVGKSWLLAEAALIELAERQARMSNRLEEEK